MTQADLHLKGLKYQLSSHFLFNVLNTVRVLIRKEPVRAGELVSLLSDYLRYSLHKLDHFYATLSEEKAGAELFMKLQEIRFRTTILVNWAIPEELMASVIPSLMLQPLIESVFKNAAPNEQGVQTIQVNASEKNNMLNIEVLTSEANPVKESTTGFIPKSDVELGVEEVHDLLNHLYGSKAHVTQLHSGSEKKISLQIPLTI